MFRSIVKRTKNKGSRKESSDPSRRVLVVPLVTRLMIGALGCGYACAGEAPAFGPGQAVGTVAHSSLKEISGIAVSRQNADVIWAHNDSGGSPRVFAMNSAGTHLGIYNLPGAQAIDYEDMAIGPGPTLDSYYLYVADTGNNSLGRNTVTVYRALEPVVDAAQQSGTWDLAGVEALTMSYPGPNYDCETLLVDPLSDDIYLVTRDRNSVSEDVSFVFRNPAPQTPGDNVTLELVTSFPAPVEIKGGDVSPDGWEILLRPHSKDDPTDALWWGWDRDSGASLLDVFAEPGCAVPAVFEPQGEAIAFSGDGLSYYTISEGSEEPIYHYTVSTGPGPLFSDGFESGGFTAGGWTVESPASASPSAASAGSYGALLKKSASITNSVNVAGQSMITLSYSRQTSGLGAGEFLVVEHSSDGTNWAQLEEVGGTTGWGFSSFQFSVTLPDYYFRFRVTGSAGRDQAMVDEVLLTGASGTTNFPPVANDDAYITAFETDLTLPAPGVLGNDTDANGDPLEAILGIGPSHGVLSFASDGWFSYTPDSGYSGPDSFTYTADDGNSVSDSATVTITVQAPVGEATSVHIESIVVGTVGAGQGNKAGTAVVLVLDNNGNPVAGVVVEGDFTGSIEETLSGVTDGNGQVVLTTTKFARKKVNVTFCVTSVMAGVLDYDSGANVVNCGQN